MGSSACLCPYLYGYKHMLPQLRELLSIEIQVFTLAHRLLYTLNHQPSPDMNFF